SSTILAKIKCNASMATAKSFSDFRKRSRHWGRGDLSSRTTFASSTTEARRTTRLTIGPECIQTQVFSSKERTIDEDCLYINVITPDL
ncbi:hypothetical protein PFISCL1PPCAC_7446, partial [Pristionchus fissidentatus]